MASSIQSIPLDKLLPHPDNPNRMSKANLAKLVRNIERSGRYEPLIVRPCPDKSKTVTPAKAGVQKDDDAMDSRLRGNDIKETGGRFQIINGYHRCHALAKLGYKTADCIVWDIDDEQADILLATLNRLGGSDNLDKKIDLLKRLNKKMESGELAKLLPQTAKQIEHVTSLKMPNTPVKINAKCFSNPMVFFVNDAQQKTIENALSLAEEPRSEIVNPQDARRRMAYAKIPTGMPYGTKAAKRAAALAQIAGDFLNRSKSNSRT